MNTSVIEPQDGESARGGAMARQIKALKAGGAVQMVADLTRMERCVWSVLVFSAYTELLDDEVDWHSIPVGVLAKFVGHTSRNTARLREILESLQTTLVRFNYIGSDQKNAWSSVQLAGRIRVENGMIYYRFDKDLRRELASSDLLAKLDVDVYRHFTSVHAMVLYENAALYRDHGATPVFSIAQWRALMNSNGTSTATPGRFLERVIRPAMDEVNTITDIRVEPVLETERSTERGGRPTITSLSFTVRPAPELKVTTGAILPEGDTVVVRGQGDLPSDGHVVGSSAKGYAEHPIVSQLTRLGMHFLASARLVEERGEAYVAALLDLYELQQHTIKRPAAWISAMSKRMSPDEIAEAIRQTPRSLPMPDVPQRQLPATRGQGTVATSASQDREAEVATAASEAFKERMRVIEAKLHAFDPTERAEHMARFLEWIKDANPIVYRFATQAARSNADPMVVPLFRVAFLEFLGEDRHTPSPSSAP